MAVNISFIEIIKIYWGNMKLAIKNIASAMFMIIAFQSIAIAQIVPVNEAGVVSRRADYEIGIMGSAEEPGKAKYSIKSAAGYSRLSEYVRQKKRQIDDGLLSASLLQTTGVRSLGPSNFPGRVTSIAVDRTNPQRLMIGTPNGGVWETMNQGLTWAPIGDLMTSLSITKVIISKHNSATSYAATGERTTIGAGLFKSQDAGVSWSLVASTDPSIDSRWRSITAFIEHPSNPQVLYAGLGSGVLMKSSDGGATWLPKSTGSPGGVCDIEIDPNNSNFLVLGACAVGSIKYSANGGESWQISTSPSNLGNADLAYAKAKPGSVYALLESGGASGELWKSTNSGVSFSKVGSTSHVGGNPFYNNVIWVDPKCYSPPSCDQHLVIGGVTLWRSTNGGVSFTQITPYEETTVAQDVEPFNVERGFPHVDNHVIVESPDYTSSMNGRIYIGTDGGVFATDNISAINAGSESGWLNLGRGLETTQFYSFGITRPGLGSWTSNNGDLAGGFSIGGAQDNGTLVKGWGAIPGWRKIGYADGGAVADADEHDTGSLDWFAIYSSQFAFPYGLDSSMKRRVACDGLNFGGCVSGTSETEFIAPIVSTSRYVDMGGGPILVGTAWLGGRSLWRLQIPFSRYDYGQSQSWQNVFMFGSNISALGTNFPGWENLGSETLWVALADRSVYRVTNLNAALPSVIRMATPGCTGKPLSIQEVSDALFITCGGFDGPNIFKSLNGAQTWVSVQGDLPAQPVFDVKANKLRQGLYYLATESGLWATSNSGVNWLPITNVPAVRITKLASQTEDGSVAGGIRLATFGRGVLQYSTFFGYLESDLPGGVDPDSIYHLGDVVNLTFTVRNLSGVPIPGVKVYFSEPAGLVLDRQFDFADQFGVVEVSARVSSSALETYLWVKASVGNDDLLIVPADARVAIQN